LKGFLHGRDIWTSKRVIDHIFSLLSYNNWKFDVFLFENWRKSYYAFLKKWLLSSDGATSFSHFHFSRMHFSHCILPTSNKVPNFFSHHELFPTNKVPNFLFPNSLFPIHFSHLRQNCELTFPENSKEIFPENSNSKRIFSENSKEIFPNISC